MNTKPVSYHQTNAKWKNKAYAVKGETATIGSAGCGPTCAAMLLSTLLDQDITPDITAAWSLKHGYKAYKQGTYYSYFKAQFGAYGIFCKQLNSASIYGNASSITHTEAFKLLKEGNYLIACMGKGLWTSSGHFVVVWWEDGKVRILDPASTKDERLNGDVQTFRQQVKYYWVVDSADFNAPKENPEVKKARDTVQTKAKLSDATMEYLKKYKYGDDLFLKLAKAMQ